MMVNPDIIHLCTSSQDSFLRGIYQTPRGGASRHHITYSILGVALGNDLVKLNPLQPMAIDSFAVKKRYGVRLTLFGGLCVQEGMPRGTPGQVREALARLASECGAGGGYILAPAHHIQADTPIANIAAFYGAALGGGNA